jgi:pimeloyl-ACP methyl ester carboxylesterase
MAGSFDGLRTARVNDVTLAYEEQGEGEPVVLVHGSASDMRTWDGQMGPIGASFRAIRYSRRYARPNEDIDPGADDQMLPHVDDLVELLQAVDAYPAHIVGHSWGAFVALLAAIRHPEAVRSLVLMEPPVLPLFVSTPPRPAELFRLLLRSPAAAMAVVRFGATAFAPAQRAFRRGDDKAAIRAFGCGVLGKKHFEALSEARMQQVWENRGADRAQILGAGFPPLRDDEVASVRAPVLLLVGAESPPLMRRLADRLHELVPHCDRIEIVKASHIMHEDNPDMVNRSVLGFLARHAQTVKP